jgi:heme exporter protein D
MMPDLGKYATAVLSAYGVSLLLLVAIVALTWLRARRVRKKLEAAEARRAHG